MLHIRGRHGGVEKMRGGGKPHEWHPSQKWVLDPPRMVPFPPPSGVSALFFLHKNLRQSRPEALSEGSKNYRECVFLPHTFCTPHIMAQTIKSASWLESCNRAGLLHNGKRAERQKWEKNGKTVENLPRSKMGKKWRKNTERMINRPIATRVPTWIPTWIPVSAPDATRRSAWKICPDRTWEKKWRKNTERMINRPIAARVPTWIPVSAPDATRRSASWNWMPRRMFHNHINSGRTMSP